MPNRSSTACLHCDSPVPGAGTFCCTGCKEVYGLLHEQGLDRYYELAGGEAAPVPAGSGGERTFAWLEPQLAACANASVASLEVDVQGVHCAACVWLMSELFRRREGGVDVTVNPALGKVRLAFRKGFDVKAYLSEVERFGYLFGPSKKKSDGRERGLFLRMGVVSALTMNAMMFSVSFYTGLSPSDGETFTLFTNLVVALSSGVVAVGGWPFFRAAWEGLRRGVLHLDLPIASGILLAFGASLWQARSGRGDLGYFDTLNTFVLLMLVGRWLQQRVLEKNRRFLLDDDGADGIVVRRETPAALELVPAPRVREGDVLLVAPGDLVPVDAELLSAPTAFSTDWITGESEPRLVETGARIAAGSFHGGGAAARVKALGSFADSPLPALLRTGGGTVAGVRFWSVWAKVYVVAVLLLAAAGLLIWWPTDPEKALQVTVALLVVTCPCAVGIAVPLAYELAQARLRRAGIFVKSQGLLDRLLQVKKVLFDKTGTLTLGRLSLDNPEAVASLSPEVRDAAYDMAARSNHPVSRCLARELHKASARFDAAADVREVAGMGLTLTRGGVLYRLGRASWLGGEGAQPALEVDGRLVATFAIADRVRPDAAFEVRALQREGYEVWLVSGDQRDKVAATAAALGLPPERALGAQRPEEKAALVERLDEKDTLFVGDGINDSLAFERAFCAGTPAIDRPVMPGKADFFLLGDGVSGLREALAAARNLRRVVRRNLSVALAYNVLSVAACLAGFMTPLAAAVFMPASSITVIAVTVASLTRRESTATAPVEVSP